MMRSRVPVSGVAGTVVALWLLSLASCRQVVQPVGVTIPDLVGNYTEYQGKRVELTGQIVAKEIDGNFGGFWTWNYTLESGGKKVRCYESNYRMRAESEANYLVRMAMAERAAGREAKVTIVGDLRRDGVELFSMSYMNMVIRTDLKEEERRRGRKMIPVTPPARLPY